MKGQYSLSFFLCCVFKCKSAKLLLPGLIEAFTGVGLLFEGVCGRYQQKRIGMSLGIICNEIPFGSWRKIFAC